MVVHSFNAEVFHQCHSVALQYEWHAGGYHCLVYAGKHPRMQREHRLVRTRIVCFGSLLVILPSVVVCWYVFAQLCRYHRPALSRPTMWSPWIVGAKRCHRPGYQQLAGEVLSNWVWLFQADSSAIDAGSIILSQLDRNHHRVFNATVSSH